MAIFIQDSGVREIRRRGMDDDSREARLSREFNGFHRVLGTLLVDDGEAAYFHGQKGQRKNMVLMLTDVDFERAAVALGYVKISSDGRSAEVDIDE
jgi:hypothetical protein